ncbi:hypothetical protein GCM10007205_19550 [Oxalicibacterium flavum]|uniref:Uncharacterized protein n=1 Tax=Oxalicibacterium flavum TaxID=179467 RepID=A0A8J2XZG2_9BURK|nr:hypothetical protein GCM10007205_19550 [Oxalicibacterium flavum]
MQQRHLDEGRIQQHDEDRPQQRFVHRLKRGQTGTEQKPDQDGNEVDPDLVSFEKRAKQKSLLESRRKSPVATMDISEGKAGEFWGG